MKLVRYIVVKKIIIFICTGQAFFTQTGLALYHALAFEPYSYLFDVLKGYISYTADNWSDV